MVDRLVEIVRVRGNGQITLPAALRRAAEIADGDAVTIHLRDDGTIMLKPVVVMDRLEADLLLRLQLRGTGDIAADDLHARVRELSSPDEVAATNANQLQSLLGLMHVGHISRREFAGRALTVGFSPETVATLLSMHGGSDDEMMTAPEAAVHGRIQNVRISQAFHSLLYLPVYIANDVGFFADEGVDVEITTASGGPESWSDVLAGAVDYSIHDPVFAVASRDKGVVDAIAVATVCNGYAIVAAARDPRVRATDDPRDFITTRARGRTIVTQPAPDSQWAVLRYLDFLYGVQMGRDYQNREVPIGTELGPVLAGEADICLLFPLQLEQGLAAGLHEVFDFSHFSVPFALSTLCTTRAAVMRRPRTHQAVINALEKACQYAYAFPEEAVAVAQHEFPNEDPEIISAATQRCLRRLFVPQHAYVDAEAWRKSQILNRFVGTIDRVHDLLECVNNEAAWNAYRRLGHLRALWQGPRPIVERVAA